jgi:transposase
VVAQDKADRKFEAVKEYLFEAKSIHSICYRYDIGERTFYRWLHNYRKYGYSGLKDGSRRPENVRKTPDWVEEMIAELRVKMRTG